MRRQPDVEALSDANGGTARSEFVDNVAGIGRKVAEGYEGRRQVRRRAEVFRNWAPQKRRLDFVNNSDKLR
jgi:hypothetical protein